MRSPCSAHHGCARPRSGRCWCGGASQRATGSVDGLQPLTWRWRLGWCQCAGGTGRGGLRQAGPRPRLAPHQRVCTTDGRRWMAWLPCVGVLLKRWSLIYAQCSAPHSFASAHADMGSPCTTLLRAPTRPVRWVLRKGKAVPDDGTARAQCGRCGGHVGTAVAGKAHWLARGDGQRSQGLGHCVDGHWRWVFLEVQHP
jgi:hypothetical protein